MKKAILGLTMGCFLTTSILGDGHLYAQEFHLPAPGVRVHLSPEFNPSILKGIKVYPDDPFKFDFILDQGDGAPNAQQLKSESTRLIKYFLASLTVPEKDLWVNLSPYEKNRIIPDSFGKTEMGRDLLAEDYMLKQITASLIYPEDVTGKEFWKRIYEKAAKEFGTTDIPINTFNKVWIVPEKAVVYENLKAGTVYVVESRLKVMLEQDYLSLSRHSEGEQSTAEESKGVLRSFANAQNDKSYASKSIRESPASSKFSQESRDSSLASSILREVVIPELTREINEGKNFSQLRQVYNSLILAAWYKRKIKDSILAQVYADKKKIAGVEYENSVLPQGAKHNDGELIYQRYLQAFKKGVYNYIKEEKIPNSFDPTTGNQQTIPRKYFSGGVAIFGYLDRAMTVVDSPGQLPDKAMKIEVNINPVLPVNTAADNAMQVQQEIKSLEKKLLEASNDNKDGKDFDRQSFLVPIKSKMSLKRYKSWLQEAISIINQQDIHRRVQYSYVFYLATWLRIKDNRAAIKVGNFYPTVYSNSGQPAGQLTLRFLDKGDLELLKQWETEADRQTMNIIRTAESSQLVLGMVSDRDGKRQIEGLAVLLDAGEAVEISWMAIAPWNRKEAKGGKLRGVGSVLVAGAIQESFYRGYGGRVFAEVASVAESIFQKFGARPYFEEIFPEDKLLGIGTAQAQKVINSQNEYQGNVKINNELNDRAMNAPQAESSPEEIPLREMKDVIRQASRWPSAQLNWPAALKYPLQSHAFVVRRKGDVVGLMVTHKGTLTSPRPQMIIDGLEVRDDYKKNGIGKLLITEAARLSLADTQTNGRVALELAARNTLEERIYQHLHFENIEDVPRGGDEDSGYLYFMTLAPDKARQLVNESRESAAIAGLPAGVAQALVDPEHQRVFNNTSFKGNRSTSNGVVMSEVSIDPQFRAYYVDRLMKIIRPGQKLLSVGEGRGDLAEALQQRGMDVKAVDISEENTKIARARGVNQIVADASRLPYKDGSFDVVIFNESIGAMPLSQVMAQAFRVLKPNGRILISIYPSAPNRQYSARTNFLYYSVDEIRRGLQQAGFSKSFQGSVYFPPSDHVLDVVTSTKPDQALHGQLPIHPAQNGGIDFTAGKTSLDIRNAGEGIQFHLDPALLAQWQDTSGVVPVIVNIQPLNDLKSFLGVI